MQKYEKTAEVLIVSGFFPQKYSIYKEKNLMFCEDS
jgi:hypothetical protein